MTRHAGTDTCRVKIDYGPQTVTVEILDNGSGAPAKATGLGLTGMRERAQACGGQLEAHALPDRGFRVVASLPFTAIPPATTASFPVTGTPIGRTGPGAVVRDEKAKEITGIDLRRMSKVVLQALAVGSCIFLLLILTIVSWISYGEKDLCREARGSYGGDCTEALVSLLNDEHRSLRTRNDAIGILGDLRDRRALPTLQRYYTGNIPPREPLDKTISQYELRKAIRLINGETKTILFWHY